MQHFSNKNFFLLGTGAFFGFSGVILGAFGAHAFEEKLSPEALASFNTGVRYQEIHAILILFLSIAGTLLSPERISSIAIFFILGVFLFSGSIYLVSTTAITGIEFPRWFFLITPLGGLLLILGWLFILISAAQLQFNQKK